MNAAKPHLGLILFCLAVVACASITNAAMDVLSSRYEGSIFSKWPQERGCFDPGTSWKNKWKDGGRNLGPAFPLSTTVLVGLTDAWHCFKSGTIAFIELAMLAPFTRLIRLSWQVWVVIFVGVNLFHGLFFECAMDTVSNEMTSVFP